MSIRSTIMRFVFGVSILVLFFITGSMAFSTFEEMLREYARSTMGQATLTYHKGITKAGQTPLELSTSVIRGDYTQVVTRQEIARAIFVRRISDSTFPLVGIEAEFTSDGFLLVLEPTFAPTRLHTFARESVLVFLPGEGFIEQCFPTKLGQCIFSIVDRTQEIKRIYTESGALTHGSPRILVIVVGPIERYA